MVKILGIRDLDYLDFKDITLSFKQGSFYSVVGCNKSGKTTLFSLISGLIPTDNKIICDGVYLNLKSINRYIQKIGIVERITNDSFIYQNVHDEMVYPLYNLGYSKKRREKRIREVLSYFNLDDIKEKNINKLDFNTRQILLIALSLLHKPKVLLLDNVLTSLPKNIKESIINILKRIILEEEITVINFTSDLDESMYSDKIILLSNFKVLGEYLPYEIYDDDKLFYQNGLEIPFIADLSIKLKMYDVISKYYSDMKEMVDDIWP